MRLIRFTDTMWLFLAPESIAVPLEQCVLKGEFNFDADLGAYTNPGEETWAHLARRVISDTLHLMLKPGCTLENLAQSSKGRDE